MAEEHHPQAVADHPAGGIGAATADTTWLIEACVKAIARSKVAEVKTLPKMKLHADYTCERIGTPQIDISFVDEISGEKYNAALSNVETTDWPLPEVGSEERCGVVLRFKAHVPAGLSQPGACLILYRKRSLSSISRLYLAQLAATQMKQAPAETVSFLTNSWVAGADERIFFTGRPSLPIAVGGTPRGLVEHRQRELASLRGDIQDSAFVAKPRCGADRIYAYDVYNDLGGAEQETTEGDRRPILGIRDPDGRLPYPRRLRTGRPLVMNGYEKHLPAFTTPWVPYDEKFFAAKQDEFTVGPSYPIGAAASSVVSQLFHASPEVTKFASFSAVDRLFCQQSSVPPEKKGAVYRAAITDKIKDSPFNFGDNTLRRAYKTFPEQVRQAVEKQLGLPSLLPSWVPGHNLFRNGRLIRFLQGLLAKWPMPLVLGQRKIAWQSDEEVGRQAKAGCNPFTVQLANEKFRNNTKLKAEDFSGLLGGMTRDQAMSKGMLFYQDYYTVLGPDIVPEVKKVLAKLEGKKDGGKAAISDESVLAGYQYTGRGVFFQCAETKALAIVAIELQEPDTLDWQVFTPVKSRPEIWQLAKAVYSSLDSAVHQLISHWLKTHATMEPFAIATRRQLSTMHPVFQLMQPHFRYTLDINANARSTLVNAGGIVEQIFTPGPCCMEFSAKWYGEAWKFREQGLPADLMARGIAKRGEDELHVDMAELLLKDYPYAEDGLLVWDAIVKYFNEYLGMYYSDDARSGKQVTDDAELVEWYREIREEGHQDAKDVKGDCWIELKDISSLVQILATMAWIGSAHHAAVNFGQYTYNAYMPNKAAFIAHKIPRETVDNEGKPMGPLAELLNDYEYQFLSTLSGPIRAVKTMLLVKTLSNHAKDEEYLGGAGTEWILDPVAKKEKARFDRDIADAENIMIQRNTVGNSRARRSPSGIPYTLLYPSTNTEEVTTLNMGMTGRGIPTSVSI